MQDHGFLHQALVYLVAGSGRFGQVVSRYRRHDEEMLAGQAAHRYDVKQLITLSQQGREDPEQLLAAEAEK